MTLNPEVALGSDVDPCGHRAGRAPQHRSTAIHDGADEIPLIPAEPPGSRNEKDGLIYAPSFYTQAPFLRVHHVVGNEGGGGYFASVGIDDGPSPTPCLVERLSGEAGSKSQRAEVAAILGQTLRAPTRHQQQVRHAA